MKTRGLNRLVTVCVLLFILVSLIVPAFADEGKKLKYRIVTPTYLNENNEFVIDNNYYVAIDIDVSSYKTVSFPVFFSSPACAIVYDRSKNILNVIKDVPYGTIFNYELPDNAKYLSISFQGSYKNDMTVLGYSTALNSNNIQEIQKNEEDIQEEPAQTNEREEGITQEELIQTKNETAEDPVPSEDKTAVNYESEKTEEEKATEAEQEFQKDLRKKLKAVEKEQFRQDDWPLETIIHDGGFAKIFRTIGVVGDSLSSGAMTYKSAGEESKQVNVNMYEYSWIQYMARYCGSTAYNFSVSGMGTDSFFGSQYYDLMMDGEHLCQAYFIALGHNDYNRCVPIGAPEDIDLDNWENNAKTFMGNYARIISSIKSIQPTAKIFPILMKNEKRYGEYNDAIRYVSSLFNDVYLLEMDVYAVERRPWEVTLGHGNTMGYLNYSYQISSYVDWYIRHYPEEFKYVQFIGTDYEYALGLREERE